jgi:hypothetical protein
MIKRICFAALFTFSSLLFGQLDSNSVTVTANRSTNLQPDTVVFGVQVTSGLNATLDNVLAAVKGAGITSANFAGVGSQPTGVAITGALPQPSSPALSWAFALSVPFSQMTATVATLTALEQSIAQNNSGLGLSFVVEGAQVSPGLRQAQACNIPDLIADATAQAQNLATAGGLKLGQILAMSSVTSVPAAAIPALAGLGIASFGIVAPLGSSPAQVCTLTVKFGLTRF